MTDGYCFLCYSTADALDFATRLSNDLESRASKISVWFDKRNLHPGIEWDIQIDEALKSCRIVLFVMTADSTNEKSLCKQEWSRALSYKKIIIPLLLQRNIQVPFRLDDRQQIDFTGDFEIGVEQLRGYIAWMDSPAGILHSFKDRLSDAKRDVLRAKEEEKPRILAEIEELTWQIKHQEEIVRDPKEAEEKTEQNIRNGLESERQPLSSTEVITRIKFINPPPGIAPTYYQDRLIEEKEIVKFLKDDSQRLLTIVGRGGVGKTALVCRLLKALENGMLPDDLGNMKADGIIYLSEIGNHRVNFTNLFAGLCKLLPEMASLKLNELYKNPRTSTGEKMQALLDTFPSGQIVLLMDNFENLVDLESQNLCDGELSEALKTLVSGQHHAVKAIITTRIVPRDLAMCEPGRQYVLSLDEGLASPHAETVLREMDEDGHVGLKNASDTLLGKAREKTRGYPCALEALYMILSVDRYTTLEELLEVKLPAEVVHALVGQAFSRLDSIAQKVIQALAVYNRPIKPAALDYLLQPYLPGIDSTPVLNRLVSMHFARRQAGKYYLHPADREFAFETIPPLSSPIHNGEKGITFSRQDLLDRSADYFVQARKPPEDWKKLDDLSAQMAEFDLRCEAGEYDTACRVLKSIDFDYLDLWGHYHLLIDMHLRLKDKLQDKDLIMGNMKGLGESFAVIGRGKEAISFYETGLSIAREAKDRKWENQFFGDLGNAYANLGETHKAIEFYEKQLVIAREIGDQRHEGTALGDLGTTYSDLGQIHTAKDFFDQALVIARKIGDRRSEGVWLGNIGVSYANLGQARKAIEYYEQALDIARENGDRRSEGRITGNLGNAYGVLDEIKRAIECHQQALVIHHEIGDRQDESIDLLNMSDGFLSLGDYQKTAENYWQAAEIADEISFLPIQHLSHVGLANINLFQNNLGEARTAIEVALQYDMPQFNQNATALQGIIALRQEEIETAKKAFTRSIAQANKILANTPDYKDALDTKGLASCGLAVCLERENKSQSAQAINDAIVSFQAARKVSCEAGVVKSVLQLFDALAESDNKGILKEVRKAITGNK